jgi:Putative prokaryotic signal transducing protein
MLDDAAWWHVAPSVPPFCLRFFRKQLPEGAVCGYCRHGHNHGLEIGIKAAAPQEVIRSDLERVKSPVQRRIRRKVRIQNGEFMPEPRDSAGGEPHPDPNERLIKVFDSEDESEAIVVKGLLDSAGIENDLMSASLVQETFPGLGGMIILVREEDAEAARQVIAEGQSSPDDDTAEIEIIEEPPQKP